MLHISGNENCYCPYRDCLGIDTHDGRVSWYQLLGVSQAASAEEMRDRYERRRALVLKNRKSTSHPVWDNLLDELDRAIAVLTDAERKREYDEDLLRRNRQSSIVRLPGKEAEEWKAMVHSQKLKRAGKGASKKGDSQNGPREIYEPLRTIGEGPCGTRVYEAWEFQLNRRVAVRCLLRSARTAERQKSFVEEAQFLASFSHPNLVEVHVVNASSCYMVMEYLEKTVVAHQKTQKNQQCDAEFVRRFLCAGLSILKRLHDGGVVHGAIGRRCFHLSENGDFKLVDAPGCTSSGLFREPRHDQTCVAPELLSPDSFGEPGFACDLYMLGFSAVELLAGDMIEKWIPKMASAPNAGHSRMLQWHASPLERLPSLESLVKGLPPKLASVIECLCEKQVADRYSSAGEALAALNTVKESQNLQSECTIGLKKVAPAASANARQVGGDAPLVVEARVTEQHRPDVLELLQNPALLWQQIRTKRSLLYGCTGLVAMLFVLIGLASPGDSSSPRNVIADEAAKGTAQDATLAQDSEAAERSRSDRQTPPLPSVGSPNALSPDELVRPLPTSIGPEVSDLELAAVPISLETLQPTEAPDRASNESPALLTESIERFSPKLEHDADYDPLIKTLTELRDADTLFHQRRLFKQAMELAPDDPRVWFMFAASTGFQPEFRSELRRAVQLSDPKYTQPFRHLIESHINEIGSRGVAAADESIALLTDFAHHLNRQATSPDRIYDWEWIGRVIAVLESESNRNPSIAGILTATTPRILSSANAEAKNALQRGRSHGVTLIGSISKAAVLPNQPKVSMGLCLSSFTKPSRDEHQASSSVIADRSK